MRVSLPHAPAALAPPASKVYLFFYFFFRPLKLSQHYLFTVAFYGPEWEAESPNPKVIKWTPHEVETTSVFTGDFYFTPSQLLDNGANVSFSPPLPTN